MRKGLLVLCAIYLSILLINVNPKQESSYEKAPELQGIAGYINAEKMGITQNRGKVILVDFWDYSCINCIRTLPYLNDWNRKYSGKGLVIISVHTPKFGFGKEINNVKRAVEQNSIKYPVALDNDHKTWRAYNNLYWPSNYLIDAEGHLRYNHIGEGDYERTEKMIQILLMETAKNKSSIIQSLSSPDAAKVDYARIYTPEIYMGYSYMRTSPGNNEFRPESTISYTIPAGIEQDKPYLEGAWKSTPEYMELQSDKGRIMLRFNAKSAYMVAGSETSSRIRAIIDGENASTVTVQQYQLYNLANTDYRIQTLELDIEGKGLRVYSFTLG